MIVYYFSYRCLIRNSNYLLFGRTWVQARFFFVGFVLVICFLLGPCWSSVCWVRVGHLFVGSVLVICCLLGPCWSSVFCWVRVGHLLVLLGFLCCIFALFVFVLCLLLPNVTYISGLSIFDCPFVFFFNGFICFLSEVDWFIV